MLNELLRNLFIRKWQSYNNIYNCDQQI